MITLIIAVLAVLVFAILLFPVNISFNSVRSGGTIDGSLGVSWTIFFFIYYIKEKDLKIHIFGRSISRHISPEKKLQKLEPERDGKKAGKMPSVKDFLNMTGPLLRLFKELFKAFRLKCFDVDITFGHSDPAYTGILTGLMHAIRGSIPAVKKVRFAPDFTGQVLNWNLKAEAYVIPVAIALPAVKFAMDRRILKVALRNI